MNTKACSASAAVQPFPIPPMRPQNVSLVVLNRSFWFYLRFFLLNDIRHENCGGKFPDADTFSRSGHAFFLAFRVSQ